MDDPQEHRRHQAITRYLAGDKIETICRELHCAKSWLYKWKARYHATDPAWTTRRSPQPRRRPRQTLPPLVQHIVLVHQTLVQDGTSGSAAAIQQGLKQQGITPIPSLRTIYRILQRQRKEAS
jgi:hypothetical protein